MCRQGALCFPDPLLECWDVAARDPSRAKTGALVVPGMGRRGFQLCEVLGLEHLPGLLPYRGHWHRVKQSDLGAHHVVAGGTGLLEVSSGCLPGTWGQRRLAWLWVEMLGSRVPSASACILPKPPDGEVVGGWQSRGH